MEIIGITEDNIEQMVEIWNEHRNVLTSHEMTITADGLQTWKELEPIEFFGVVVDEDISDEIGGFFVTRNTEDSILIEQVAISKEHQGIGVGNAVVRYCKYLAKSKGDLSLKTKVLIPNYKALNFFFGVDFVIEDYNEDDNDYVMIAR